MATITCTTETIALAPTTPVTIITGRHAQAPTAALSVTATTALRAYGGPLPTRHFSLDPWGMEEYIQYCLNGNFDWAGYVPTYSCAKVCFYSGSQPESPDTGITSQVLLGQIDFLGGSLWQGVDWEYDVSDNLVLHYEGATQNPVYTSIAAGTVTWFRVFSDTGAALFDGSVGTTDADLIVNSQELDGSVEIRIDKFDLIYQHTERG